MAEPATYNGPIDPITKLNGGTALPRGLRATLDANGKLQAAAAAQRGDYIALEDIAVDEYGMVVGLGAGGSIPAVASEAVAVGDDAYSAASGKSSKTATNAVFMGRWIMAAAQDKLGVIQLLPIK